MKSEDIAELAKVFQKQVSGEEKSRRINAVFARKKNRTVLKELTQLIQPLEKNIQNEIVLIVIMALARRDLNHIMDLEKSMEQVRGELLDKLYGGMMICLCGRSSRIHVEIKWSNEDFVNQYEYIMRFRGEFYYFEFIELHMAAKIIALWDIEKFNRLVMRDPNYLFLLNMFSRMLDIEPTPDMERELLCSSDELRAAVGFGFIVDKVNHIICNWENKEHMAKINKMDFRKEEVELGKELAAACAEFESKFSCCDKARRVSLLLDYILVKKRYPVIFVVWLLDGRNHEELLHEIRFSGKLKSIKDIGRISEMIRRYHIRKNGNEKANKSNIYRALVAVLIELFEKEKGVYWNQTTEKEFRTIVESIPGKYLKPLARKLRKQKELLLCTELDKMVRFSFYLKDSHKLESCSGALKSLSHLFPFSVEE